MFNPRPTIVSVSIGAGREALVVDDALLDPERWVEFALAQQHAFGPAPFNAYPGRELQLPVGVSAYLADFFGQHIRRRLQGRRTLEMYSRLSQVTLAPHELAPIQWLCHRDRMGVLPNQTVAASVLYLFKEVDMGGTSFFEPRRSPEETEQLMRTAATADPARFAADYGVERAYLVDSNAYFTRTGSVAAKWNRMVFYDGSIFHSPAIRRPELLNREPGRGRLTLNGFFTCSRVAS